MMRILSDRRVWLVLAAVAAFLAVRQTGLASYLSLDTLKTHRETLTGWVGENWALAALAYVGVYIVAVAFSMPLLSERTAVFRSVE